MNSTKKRSPAEPLAVIGIHSVAALLNEHFDKVIKVWIAANNKNTRLDELATQAEQQSISLEMVKPKKLDDITHAHQGVIAWCKPPLYHDFHWLESRLDNMHNLLVLDRITDPHNFGACLRTAEAGGIDAVLIPYRHTSALNTGTAKSASGALFRLPLVQLPLAKFLQTVQGYGFSVIGLSEHADQSIYQLPRQEKVVFALGSEENGLSPAVMSNCSQLVSIPCQGRNASLNVSVAAGIAMFSITNAHRNI